MFDALLSVATKFGVYDKKYLIFVSFHLYMTESILKNPTSLLFPRLVGFYIVLYEDFSPFFCNAFVKVQLCF